MHNLSPKVFLASLACAFASPTFAQEAARQGLSLSLGTGVDQTDNAFKTSVRERSETKEYLDLDVGFLRDSEYLTTTAQYSAELANYENDTTEQNSLLTGSTKLAWKLLPGRVQVDLSHDRSEQMRDSRNPDIRNNRELRDIISAGPRFMARLSPVDQVVVSGLYSEVSYDGNGSTALPEQSRSDSERLSGGLSWQHQLQKTDLLSASYQYSEAKFDQFTEEFSYHQLYGTYAVKLRNSGYTVSLGVNRSERASSGDKTDGFYAQVGGNLRSGGHSFNLTAINELTDSGMGLGGNGLVGGDFRPNDTNFDIVDSVERTSFSLGYGYDRLCERCEIGVNFRFDEQDFDTQPRDQTNKGAGASFGYKLTPTLKLSLRGDYSEIEYPQDAGGGRTDKLQNYGFTLDWMLSRSLTMRAWISDEQRKSDAALQGYDELFGGVSVSYRFR